MPKGLDHPSISRSIPLRISFVALILESLFFISYGWYNIHAFNQQVDHSIERSLSIPGALISQGILEFSSAANRSTLSKLIQLEPQSIFIIKPDGTILHSSSPETLKRPYRELLHQQENKLPFQTFEDLAYTQYTTEEGKHFYSCLAPLTNGTIFYGNIFIRAAVDELQRKKNLHLSRYVFAACMTMFFTVVILSIFIHTLMVPRLEQAVETLSKISRYRFNVRPIAPGAMDQLGIFLGKINAILATIAEHNRDLRNLNIAAEQLAATENKQQLYTTATNIICRFFDVRQSETDQRIESQSPDLFSDETNMVTLTVSDDETRLFLSMPIPEEPNEFVWIKFSGKNDKPIPKASNKLYIAHLARILRSAIHRINTFHDIAMAEERYRELFSSAAEGIFRTTAEGRFETVNPALANMSGYASPEEMITGIKNIGAQFYANSKDRAKVFSEMLEYGKIVDREVFLRRKDGSVFPAAISSRYVTNDQGGIVAFEGRVINIEERKLREREEQNRKAAEAVSRVQLELVSKLEENERILQRSLKEKEILLREIYHRTKNNMLVIISMLKLQMQKISDPAMHTIFRETENRIRAMSLVHEKLYQSDSLVEIDLGNYLAEMVTTLVSTMVVDDCITVETDTIAVPISIDHAVPLGLAVNEIVTNSLKHAFPKGKKGIIALQLCLTNDNMIELHLKDSGVGVPADFILEQSASFGLQMAKNLVTKQLGGTMTIEKNHGTEITIRFIEPERHRRIDLQ